MKILHLADLHLGKIVLGLSMIEDQRHVLNGVIDLCRKENIKHIIISGDVYDRSIPSEEAVALLDEFLSKAVLEEYLHLYIISGNHDSQERLACFSSILEKQGLYIDNDVSQDLKMNKHVINEDGLIINIYSLPYLFPADIRHRSGDDSIRNFEGSVKKILDSNELSKDEINIINAHYFVTGEEEIILSDSETKTSVGTIEQISYRLFDDFDYVALGHLHCPQKVGREVVSYAGSPLRYSVDEIKQDKVFNIINIKSKNDITLEKANINPLREFALLTGTIDELTKDSQNKYYRILFFEITDTSYVLNGAARLKIKYPNFVGMKYINIKEELSEEESKLEKEAGFDELPKNEQLSLFFKFINDKDLDSIQKEVVDKVIEEVERKGL